jgi:glycosyltransferase involved in cell wall biosynthesis
MVIFQTAEDRDAWTRVFHAGSTRVIPSGYSSVFSRGDREEARRKTGMEGEPLVLWVGYLGARKDPLTVLRGFRRFAEHFPGATLHFVGDGSLEERLRGEASADPILADRTILHGAMPQRLVPDFYRSADIFVLGSRSEGFCGACLEAMACGVVPVVTDVSGFRGVTDRGRVGLLYPPGDSDALAAALTKLTLNSRLRLRMAEEALEWVVQFRWDRIAERLEALYAELLENPFKAPHPPSGPSRMRV